MKENSVNPYTSHQETLLVLPWYVNKTLSDTEMKAVENHLKVCLVCNRELATLQKLSIAVNRADTLDSVAQASFSRIKNRIHKISKPIISEPAKTGAPAAQTRWYEKFGFGTFNWLQPAALTFAVLMLAISIPGYFVADKMLKSDFRTLSNGESTTLGRYEAKVVFVEGLTQQQMQSVLDTVHGQIVDGPTPEGIYLIRIATQNQSATYFESISSLRKNSNVIFAEPAYALLSSSQPNGVLK